ncbi:MAG: terminase small subunit [Alphaproteobacteria bacterium]|jgi:phage terminase small subunit|nr:terminase small subunit [Alphaproteobacteria bacterium]
MPERTNNKPALSARQDAFCRALVEGRSGAAAAAMAGYAEGSAKVAASRLLTKDNVKRRVAELRTEAQERHIVTVDNVVRDLITLRDEARAAKQYAAAAKCQQLVGMTIGSFVDRREISTPREALDTELEQLAAQLGMSADDLARRLMN